MARGVLFLLVATICIYSTGAGHGDAATPVTSGPPLLPMKIPPGSIGRFPCPKHPLSTVAMESCSVRRLVRLNIRADKLIEVIWRRLRNDPGRRLFASAEKSWQAYANNECRSRYRVWTDPKYPHVYSGGTAAPLLYSLCLERLTAAHIHDLKET